MTARPASSEMLWQHEFSQGGAEIAHYLLRDRTADRIGEAATKKAVDEVVAALIRRFTATSTGQAPR